MALVSADSRIAELLTELHQLIKQTQVKSHSPPFLEGNMGCDAEVWRGGKGLCSERLDVQEGRGRHEGERRRAGLPFLLGYPSRAGSHDCLFNNSYIEV